MVRLRLLCAGLLLCLLTFNSQAVTQETYLHAASRLQFPDQLGTAKRLSVQHFEDPRLGIAVSYRIPGLGRADFYVYQSDVGPVPVGLNSEPMRRALADAHGDVLESVRRGAYSSAEPLFPATNTYELPDRIPRILFSAYRLSRPATINQPLVSWMFMTGMADHFVKIRVSHSELQMPMGQQRVAETLSEFFAVNRAYWPQ